MLKIWKIVALGLVSALFVVLETTAASNAVDAKPALEQRIAKYWAARQIRDIKTLYEMESGSLPGKGLTLDKAMGLAGLRVKNVKTQEIAIDGERATVQLKGDVLIGALGWTPQTLQETWVLIDGQWYHETKLQE